jgi:predicted secreted protein
MAAQAGRNLRIKYDPTGGTATDAAVIAGARTESLTINNTGIDITDKDDSGVRTMLNDVGTKGMSLSCEGVLTDNTLMQLAASAASTTALHTFIIEIPGLRKYSGLWFIESFEASGAEGDEPVTFSTSLVSAGAITSATA